MMITGASSADQTRRTAGRIASGANQSVTSRSSG
jgi:hypothetical protein